MIINFLLNFLMKIIYEIILCYFEKINLYFNLCLKNNLIYKFRIIFIKINYFKIRIMNINIFVYIINFFKNCYLNFQSRFKSSSILLIFFPIFLQNIGKTSNSININILILFNFIFFLIFAQVNS